MADTEDGRETLVGLVEACFGPDGKLNQRSGRVSENAMLEGYLEVAQKEGFDPRAIYEEALSNLGRPPGAPSFEDVAPRLPA